MYLNIFDFFYNIQGRSQNLKQVTQNLMKVIDDDDVALTS